MNEKDILDFKASICNLSIDELNEMAEQLYNMDEEEVKICSTIMKNENWGKEILEGLKNKVNEIKEDAIDAKEGCPVGAIEEDVVEVKEAA